MRPFAIVAYGPPGVGKTSFLAGFQQDCKVGIFHDPKEEGILDLIEYGQCPEPSVVEEFDSFEGLIDIAVRVSQGQYDIDIMGIDSLTGVERLCFEYHCNEYFDGDWTKNGFYSYQQGPKNAAKTDWPRFLDAMDLVRSSGVNVMLLGHSHTKNYNNPEAENYDRYTPYLDKEIWSSCNQWAQAILYLNYDVQLEKARGESKKKANTDRDDRFIYTEWSPVFDAKNRMGLPPIIEMGDSGDEAYLNFKKAVENTRK